MKLSYVTIGYYRSITEAYKIDLSNLTLLLGKNNEGKTNIIKAIELGMEILQDADLYVRRKRIISRLYNWHEDYPLSLQKSKLIKNKQTKIRFDFSMEPSEASELSRIIGSTLNTELSIYFSIGEENVLSVTVPKRGKNATAISKKVLYICDYICSKFNIQYIPAIRAESDAYETLANMVEDELSSIVDDKYLECLDYIENIQQNRLTALAARVRNPLKNFLPSVKAISINLKDRYRRPTYSLRRSLNIEMDDGVLTSLSNKGDGVKSLTTIALLSQISSNKNRLIIVDEPENHLHPEAIRYICTVLYELGKENQVLISTHSPIFVNRDNIKSNIIVDSGKAVPADRIDTLRKTLGVMCSDNLMYSDYVIVVEGPTDKTLVTKYLYSDRQLNNCLINKSITVRAVGGTNNIKSEVYSLQRYCCNYLILLDSDPAGKNAANQLKQEMSVPSEKIRYFSLTGRTETELEDLLTEEMYKDLLLEKGIDISNPIFKNKSKKWSRRLSDIAQGCGINFSDMENECKEKVSYNVKSSDNYLNDDGKRLLAAIKDKIRMDLISMGILK